MIFSYLPRLDGMKYPVTEVYLVVTLAMIFFWFHLYRSKKTFGLWTGPLVQYAGCLTVGMSLIFNVVFGVVISRILWHDFEEATTLDMNIEKVLTELLMNLKAASLSKFMISSFPLLKMICFFPLLEYNKKQRWTYSKTHYLVCSPFMSVILIMFVGNLGIILPLLFIESFATFAWFSYRVLRKQDISRNDVYPYRWIVILIQLFCFASVMVILIRAMTIEDGPYHWTFFISFLSLLPSLALFAVEIPRKHDISSFKELKDEYIKEKEKENEKWKEKKKNE